MPYFKNKTIKNLTSKNIRLYFESLKLSLARKRINTTCFKKLFQFLEEEEHIKKSEIPTLPKVESNKVENCEAFTVTDHKNIMKELQYFIVWVNQTLKLKSIVKPYIITLFFFVKRV